MKMARAESAHTEESLWVVSDAVAGRGHLETEWFTPSCGHSF